MRLCRDGVTFSHRIGQGHFGHVWEGKVVEAGIPKAHLQDKSMVAVKLFTATVRFALPGSQGQAKM